MYRDFYGLSEVPFSPHPDADYWFENSRFKHVREGLSYILREQSGFIVLTGPAGTGKSQTIGHLLAGFPANVTAGYVNNNYFRDIDELFQWILLAFDCDYHANSRAEFFHIFADFLITQHKKGQRVILIIEEAHQLSPKALDQLRMLANINANKQQLLRLILVGQPKLLETLKAPRNLAFAQGVMVERQLYPLNSSDTTAYIYYRIEGAGGDPFFFSQEACETVWRHTLGIPRLINTLCDAALLNAFNQKIEVIESSLVEMTVSDLSLCLNTVNTLRESTKEEGLNYFNGVAHKS